MSLEHHIEVIVVDDQPLSAHLPAHLLGTLLADKLNTISTLSVFPNSSFALEELVRRDLVDSESGGKLAILFCCEGVSCISTEMESLVRKAQEHECCSYSVAILKNLSRGAYASFRSAGFNGVIPVTFNVNQLIHSFNLIVSGVDFFPTSILPKTAVTVSEARAVEDCTTTLFVDILSPRQREVMGMLSQGYANKAIATNLGVAERTVKIHVSDIMKKLGADNRTHAVSLFELNKRSFNTDSGELAK